MIAAAASLLAEFVRPAGPPLPPLLVCVAHPDDETIGAGGCLVRLRAATFAYVTDGAPRDLADARAAGCLTRAEYQRLRAAERRGALALAGVDPAQVRGFGCTDQEASLQLPELARRVAELLRELRPAGVLTHPYEGGHPDHDATTFAVHAGCGLLRAAGETPPCVLEFASYHNAGGAMCTGAFLPGTTTDEREVVLSDAQRERKRRMLACYASQRITLSQFSIRAERFRRAPTYHFTAPPQGGRLFYELFEWGMTGPRWRALAAEALRALELSEPL